MGNNHDINYYWNIVRVPFFILIGWQVLGLIMSFVSVGLYISIFGSISGWILTVAVFGFIGYIAVKDHKGSYKEAMLAGLMTGAMAGLAGAIIGIIMVNVSAGYVEMLVGQMTAQGLSDEMARQYISMGSYIGILAGPVVNGIVGLVLALLGGLVGKKI